MNFRKRAGSAALTITLFALVLAGCASSGRETEVQTEQSVQVSAMEQLNSKNDADIIDDNYRTTYEVFVHSFYDSNDDGIGDLNGLTEKLDYIQDLGCNEIWMMPVMPSPSYHKYDVIDYENIDPQYGTLEDFDNLISKSHEKGINIIIDFVVNHTSNEHPWFKDAAEYMRSLGNDEQPDASECPYVDYYKFSKEVKAGYNKLSGTDWYYESQFVDSMPDLNLENENVRAEIDKIVSFWIEHGVDGFRLDAVTHYNDSNETESINDLTWLVNDIKSKKQDAYVVGEGWTTYREYAKYYKSGIDSMFDFDMAQQDGYIAKVLNGLSKNGATTYGNAITDIDKEIRQYTDSYINAPFYTNHDMGRSAGYYNGDFAEERTKMAQAMNLLMPGNCFIYYGEEIGMRGAADDPTKRLGMLWSGDSNEKGMCDDPEGAQKVEHEYGSLEEQKNNPYSIYNFVRQTNMIRNAFPEIARGENVFEKDLSDDKICVFTRAYNGQKIVIIFNTSQDEAEVDVSKLGVSRMAAMLQTDERAPEYDNGTAKMPAYSVILLK